MPVIPVAVLGTDVVAPPGKKFGTFTRPGVRFGKPLDFSRYEGMENDRYVLRSITDEIMYEIMRLSGQEYVDMYAGRAKELATKAAQEAKEAAKEEARRAKAAAARRERAPPTRTATRTPGGRRRAGRRAQEGVLSLRRAARGRRRRRRRPRSRTGCTAPSSSLRVVVLVNAVVLNLYRRRQLRAPRRWRSSLVVVMAAWTAFAIWAYADARRRRHAAAAGRPGPGARR